MRKALVLNWLLVLAAFAPMARAQTSDQVIVIAPFKIHSQENLPKIQEVLRDTLSQQLKDEGLSVADVEATRKAITAMGAGTIENETQARTLGQKLKATSVIFGSFSQVGNHISIDAKLVDVQGLKKTEVLLADEEGIENLAAPLNKIRQQLAVHLLSKAVVSEISVKGNDRIEAEAIKAVVKSAKGEVLRPTQVRDDVKAVYQMGYFEDVEAEISDGPGGKILTFVVKEKPSVQEVRIKGNKKIKEKDILAAIHTKPYTVLQLNVVNDDVQRILKLYHEKGYFNAAVKSTIEYPKDPRQAVVTFTIEEHSKIYINKISFTGNKAYSARKLRGVMQTKEKMFLVSLFSDRGILQDEKLNTDVDRLTAFYNDHGFMDAKVGTPKVNRHKEGITIEIPIQEGERYRVASVEVTGDALEGVKEVNKRLESKPKEYFSREKLRHDIDYLSKLYMNQGYAYTDVSPQVQRDPSTHTTTINFQIKKGQKIHIERIFVTGNTKTRDSVIRHQLKLAEGDTFNATQLEQSNTNLKKVDFFEQYEIAPSEGSSPDAMNLNVKVKEKSTGAISIGGGYSSDDGLFAGGEIFQRNLFGKGQSLGLKAQVSTETQRYSLSYLDPWFMDSEFAAGFDIYNWNRDYSDFTKDAQGFVVKTGHPFGNFSRILASYNFENADVTDVAPGSSAIITSQEGRQIKSSVTTTLERDTTDHPFLATRGSINSATVEVSSGAIGSDSDFASYVISSAWYIPLYWKFVGYIRGRFGYMQELTDENNIPVYERFFLGGINSHRAFDWGELGPHDPTTIATNPPLGDEIGGTKFGLVNMELLFPLVEKLGMRGVVFFDAGNAYLNSQSLDITEFRPGAGVGVVWGSPFGPLRVYWAYNLDKQVGEDQYKFQFAMGYYF